MAKTRVRKEEEVKAYTDQLRAQSVIMADTSRLKVNTLNAFRQLAKKESVGVQTAKKTLLKLAAKDAGVDLDVDRLAGSVTMLVGLGDAVAPAKLLAELKKANKEIEIPVLGGMLEAKWLDAKAVDMLAKMPSKQEMLAKVVGTIQAPLSSFVGVLNGNLRNLVQVVNAIKDAKSA
jgi:large subunit ribosomal protein L10